NVWRERKPYLSSDLASEPDHLRLASATGSELAVPIVAHADQVIGVLSVYSRRTNAFKRLHAKLLEWLATLPHFPEPRSNVVDSLREVAEAATVKDRDAFLQLLIAKVCALLPAIRTATIWLLDAAHQGLFCAASSDDTFRSLSALPLDESYAG